MPTLTDYVETLLKELIKSREPCFLPKQVGQFPLTRGAVSDSEGRLIWLSSGMESAINDISRNMRNTYSEVGKTHSNKEWNKLVRTLLGPIIDSIDLDLDISESSKIIVKKLRAGLDEGIKIGESEYAFACSFLSIEVEPISIGPLTIETRHNWLTRKSTEGAISRAVVENIEHSSTDRTSTDKSDKFEIINEEFLKIFLSECQYVCSVRTSGIAREFGAEKARNAARLGLTAIALMWKTPSKALRGFNLQFDGSVRIKSYICFVSGVQGLTSQAMSAMPHGPFICKEDWNEIYPRYYPIFEIFGECLDQYLGKKISNGRSRLMNVLLQALNWFHYGCRQESNLVAIIAFTASLDALAGGKQQLGITQLVEARLGLAPDRIMKQSNETVKSVIERLYKNGRSRTVHGTNEKFDHDWSEMRDIGEYLAGACLLSCIKYIHENAHANPEMLREK